MQGESVTSAAAAIVAAEVALGVVEVEAADPGSLESLAGKQLLRAADAASASLSLNLFLRHVLDG